MLYNAPAGDWMRASPLHSGRKDLPSEVNRVLKHVTRGFQSRTASMSEHLVLEEEF